MAQVDTGIPYIVTAESISVVTNGGTGYDLVQLATSSAVPILVQRIVVTSSLAASQNQRIQVVSRSTASTGGSAATAKPLTGVAAAATTVAHLLVTTTGTLANAYDSMQWNEFSAYEFQQYPRGIFVPPSSWLSLFVPAGGAVAFTASYTIEFVEFK